MSLRDPYGRRRPSAWRRLLVVLALLSVAAAAAGGALALQAARDEAQDEIGALRAELEAANSRLAVLEGRLAALEAADTAGQVAALQSAYDALAAEVSAIKRAQAAPPEGGQGETPAAELPPEVRLAVARQTQAHSLSCESSAASMAAQYLGVALSEADVLDALPRDDNPHLGFRGNVDGPTGGIDDYGVYAAPVAAVLNSRGLRATLVEGGLDGIKAAIARGNPVVAWVTYNCGASTPIQMAIDGREVVLVPYQHAVVVTGYTSEGAGGVWANDPYDGGEDFYPTSEFERALAYFGDMAIEVALP